MRQYGEARQSLKQEGQMRPARRFYANTEVRSWNLVSGNPASQHVAHDAVQHIKDGINEVAYLSYKQYAEDIGVVPLSFSAWSRVSDRIEATDLKAHHAFHGHYGDLYLEKSEERSDHLTARAKGLPTRPVYSSARERFCPGARSVVGLGGAE